MKRRELLASGGALVVALRWRDGAAQGPAPAGAAAPPPLPGSLPKQPFIDGWVRIGADGAITVFTGKAELGQGIKTALIQVAAEELMVAPARITLVTADTERTADEGYTAGSHSMQDSGTAIRHAAAQARVLLQNLAAERLSVPPAQLMAADGVVSGGGRSVTYGQLVAGDVLHVAASPTAVLRDPKLHTTVGKPLQRVDIPAKVSGGAAYVQDLRLPGMVHGRIVRPPGPRSQLQALDIAQVERLPGVLKVVRDGRFVGVVAQREYQAVVAMRSLAAAARWAEPADAAALPAPERLYETLLQAPSQEFVILDRSAASGAVASGPVAGAISGAAPGAASVAAAGAEPGAGLGAGAGAGAASGPPGNTSGEKLLSATYRRPYQLHGSIGPSCAVAQAVDGKYTVWTHTQGVFPLRKALAELLGVAPPQVRCIHTEGSGCYGHNAADDVAADAVLLARALPGRPVRVQWMREDEHAWEPFGPPMVAQVQARLDASGAIVDWQYGVWSNTHSTRPGAAGDLLAGTHLAQPFAPTPPKPLPQPEGGGDRNAIPLYTLPTARVTHHFLPQMPLRVSALRSLGAYLNVFTIESFVDELALAARADPVQFRLRHMADRRARDVMQLAAERFGWTAFEQQQRQSAAAPGQGLRGRGFAFARYKNLAGFAAIACEVEVRRDSGEVRLVRAVAAVDVGETVNPDGLRNQVEGGIVQSLSWSTMESVAFDATRITSVDWAGYPILRFPQVPTQIDVHIIDRPGLPFLGAGEVTQGPAAAAIANAVANATGVRFRDLPLSRATLRAAFVRGNAVPVGG